jgi:hypothetical protein
MWSKEIALFFITDIISRITILENAGAQYAELNVRLMEAK